MAKDFLVSTALEVTADIIVSSLTDDKAHAFFEKPTLLLDNYRVSGTSGSFVSLVFSWYYARVGSYVTLVVSLSEKAGQTRVHVATGGYKMWDSDAKLDFGAGTSFVRKVEEALQEHLTDRS